MDSWTEPEVIWLLHQTKVLKQHLEDAALIQANTAEKSINCSGWLRLGFFCLVGCLFWGGGVLGFGDLFYFFFSNKKVPLVLGLEKFFLKGVFIT